MNLTVAFFDYRYFFFREGDMVSPEDVVEQDFGLCNIRQRGVPGKDGICLAGDETPVYCTHIVPKSTNLFVVKYLQFLLRSHTLTSFVQIFGKFGEAFFSLTGRDCGKQRWRVNRLWRGGGS